MKISLCHSAQSSLKYKKSKRQNLLLKSWLAGYIQKNKQLAHFCRTVLLHPHCQQGSYFIGGCRCWQILPLIYTKTRTQPTTAPHYDHQNTIYHCSTLWPSEYNLPLLHTMTIRVQSTTAPHYHHQSTIYHWSTLWPSEYNLPLIYIMTIRIQPTTDLHYDHQNTIYHWSTLWSSEYNLALIYTMTIRIQPSTDLHYDHQNTT